MRERRKRKLRKKKKKKESERCVVSQENVINIELRFEPTQGFQAFCHSIRKILPTETLVKADSYKSRNEFEKDIYFAITILITDLLMCGVILSGYMWPFRLYH